MSSRMPFGNNTLVIPLTFVPARKRPQGGGGMSRMEDQAALFRDGVAPPTVSIRGEPSYAPVPRQGPRGPSPQASAQLVSAVTPASSPKEMPEGAAAPNTGVADRARVASPPAAQTPARAAEPEHSRYWWWLHGIGLASTRHEKTETLRRGMGAESGVVYYGRDGVPLDVEQMSDDEVLELERQTRGQHPAHFPDVAVGADPATLAQITALRRNMITAGKIQSDDPRPVHHIVPGGGPNTGGRNPVVAQRQLSRLGVGLDAPENGVPLSREFHQRIHNRDYYRYVEQRLAGARTREEAVATLDDIRAKLIRADEAFQLTGKLENWP